MQTYVCIVDMYKYLDTYVSVSICLLVCEGSVSFELFTWHSKRIVVWDIWQGEQAVFEYELSGAYSQDLNAY